MRTLSTLTALALLTGCVSLPEGTTLTLAPDSPLTTDDLVATLGGDLGDPEQVTWEWTWERNGEVQADISAGEVSAALTSKGETWTVQAVAMAGNKEGEPLTAEVSIGNTAPVAASVSLAPAAPTTTDDVVATASGSDADGDAVTWTYAWTLDGAAVAGVDGDTLPASAFDKGAVIEVSATPNDGEVDGAAVSSAAVTVVNSAPTAPEVTVLPAEPLTLDPLECEVSVGGTDADGDALTYTVSWTVDGAAWTGSTTTTVHANDTISADDTQIDEVWSCSAIANDGTDDSVASAASADVTIGGYETMVPGVVDYAFEYNGYHVRCHAWDGDVCVNVQQMVSCDACGTYTDCDVWHETTPFNNGSNRTPLNFCAIATGDAGVVSTGTGGAVTLPAACGYSSGEHPICSETQASVHVDGVGIEENLGLMINPSYCGNDTSLITIECAGW